MYIKYNELQQKLMIQLYQLLNIYKIFHPKCKLIVTYHGRDINELHNKYLIWLYSKWLSKNDVAITVGHILKIRAEKLLGITIDHVLSAGYNDEYIFNINTPYLERDIDYLFVGSFTLVKGLDLIIDAIQEIMCRDLNFTFIGIGPQEEQLIKLTSNYNVRILDGMSQSELNHYYNKSKFLIMSSENEGFGLSLTEAMACRAVGIVRDIPQLKIQIKDNVNGYVFSGIQELVEVITKSSNLSEAEWSRLSRNGSNSSQEHSLTNVINEMTAIYNACYQNIISNQL